MGKTDVTWGGASPATTALCIRGRVVAVSMTIALLLGSLTFTAAGLMSRAHSIARGDGLGYFLYARSIVIDGDTDLTDELTEVGDHFNAFATTSVNRPRRVPSTGRLVLAWPIGAGVMMAPFYAVGWGVETLVAGLQGRPADSYGLLPQFFYGLGAVGLSLLGLWCTLACCCEIATPNAAVLATLAILLGGPLVYYTFVQPTMAHALSFGLVGLLLRAWWNMWHRGVSRWGSLLLGLTLGMAIIVRYQNMLFGILPLALVARQALQRQPWLGVKLAATCGGALLLPLCVQFMHLHSMQGPSLGVSVESKTTFVAEENAFDLGSPHFAEVLLSCQHGAFYWAPILAVATLGLGAAALRQWWARVFLLTLLAQVYLVGGLEGHQNWSGGHSFGMRYLSECGALLAPGLAALWAALAPRVGLGPCVVVSALLSLWNLGLIGAFTLRYVSALECVTYRDMLVAFGAMLSGVPPPPGVM